MDQAHGAAGMEGAQMEEDHEVGTAAWSLEEGASTEEVALLRGEEGQSRGDQMVEGSGGTVVEEEEAQEVGVGQEEALRLVAEVVQPLVGAVEGAQPWAGQEVAWGLEWGAAEGPLIWDPL